MWDGAVLTEFQIPPVVFGNETALFHPVDEHVVSFFTLATTNDFTDARDQNIHRPNGFAIFITAHIERLNRPRIIRQNDRLIEMLLGQITFMFRLQVVPPRDRVFELVSGCLKDADRLSIRKTNEVVLDDVLQRSQ